MVLQRHMPIPVWGKAAVGSEVILRFNEQEIKTSPNEQGNWKVKFAATSEGGPYKLHISAGDESLLLTDILVGEVWLCSGQSNMEWPLKNTVAGKAELSKAMNPNIRLFHLKKKHNTYNTSYSEEQLINFSKGDFFYESVWEICSPETVAEFSGVGYFFGKDLYDSLNIPIGLIQAAVGGSPAQSWISKKALASHPQLQSLVNYPENKTWLDSEIIHPWLAIRAQENWGQWKGVENAPLPGHPFAPGYLYTSALKPLAPYAIRGAIWYQGESNATHPSSYLALIDKLLTSWRSLWDQGDFPFYFVQLPKIGNRNLWPEFREAQQDCLNLSNTGMIVSIDQGHPTDVHPREKKVIGQRLSRLALLQTYGKNIAAKSPVLSSYNWDKEMHKIVLHFEHSYEGLRIREGQLINGLVMQGYLQQGSVESIEKPKTVVIEKNEITLTYSSEFLPAKIKYAWAPAPENNLTNSAGLPVAPFKIDLEGVN